MVAVQLDGIQTIGVDMAQDVVGEGVDEDAHSPASGGQVAWGLADVALGLGPEDEPHHVDA